MLFLDNPGKKRRRRKRVSAKRRRKNPAHLRKYQSKAWMDKIRPNKKRRRRKRAKAAPARRRRRRVSSSNPKRRRVMARRRRTSGRKRRRSYRRNPPRLNIMKQLTEGAVGAFQVLSGKAVARIVPQTVGLPTDGAAGLATQAGVAVVLGMLANRMLGREAGKMILVGALTAPVESFIVGANIPLLSPALSAYPSYQVLRPGAGNGVAAYNRLSAYPGASADVELAGYDNGGGYYYPLPH